MLKQLKKRLLLFYFLTTGLLLTIIIVILFLLSKKQFTENNRKSFESNARAVIEQITSENTVSYSWLAKLEANHHLLVSIRSNTVPIGYYGSWNPPTNRQMLFQKLESFASVKDLLAEQNDLNVSNKTSSTYSFYGNKGELYYGLGYSQKSFGKIISISVIQLIENEKEYIGRQILFFAGINLIGLIFVYFISAAIVNQSMICLLLHPLTQKHGF